MSLKDILAAQKKQVPEVTTAAGITDPKEVTKSNSVSTEKLTDVIPTVSTPSIHSSAVLVEMHISVWQARRKDKAASDGVTATSGAYRGSADVRKSLLPGCQELEAIKKFVANNRNAHYSMTMPWSDRGVRLLPTARYMEFHANISGIENEFHRLCEQFFAVYQREAALAEEKLGTLFHRDEYPSLEQVKRKYDFTFEYSPVAESGDFRVDIPDMAIKEVITRYEDTYARRVQEAMDDMWKRLYTPLQNMSQKLDYVDKQDNTKFRDTLVSNVLDIVGMLKDFNITGDTHLEACRVKLLECMHGVTPEALREDAVLRAQTKRSVDEVIKDLPTLDF
jgi:hypothetical protein